MTVRGLLTLMPAVIPVSYTHLDVYKRQYSIIDKEKEQQMERIRLSTPYGQFTPTEREVVSLGLVQTVVKAYYEHINAEDFLKSIPCVDTTEETKRCMGLIK